MENVMIIALITPASGAKPMAAVLSTSIKPTNKSEGGELGTQITVGSLRW